MQKFGYCRFTFISHCAAVVRTRVSINQAPKLPESVGLANQNKVTAPRNVRREPSALQLLNINLNKSTWLAQRSALSAHSYRDDVRPREQNETTFVEKSVQQINRAS